MRVDCVAKVVLLLGGEIMDIECLWCRESLELPECVGSQSYDGEVRCDRCSQYMYIKLVGGELQKRKRAKPMEPEQMTAIHMMQLISNLEKAFEEYLKYLRTKVKAELEYKGVAAEDVVEGRLEYKPVGDEEIEAEMMKKIGEEVRRFMSG